jgi:hypothetical protein
MSVHDLNNDDLATKAQQAYIAQAIYIEERRVLTNNVVQAVLEIIGAFVEFEAAKDEQRLAAEIIETEEKRVTMNQEIEHAFHALDSLGVSETRAKTLSNGIRVLAADLRQLREEASAKDEEIRQLKHKLDFVVRRNGH